MTDEEPLYSTIIEALKAETDPAYRRCLSRLSDVSPAFTLPDHPQLLSLGQWPLTEYIVWLERRSSCAIASSGDSGTGKSLVAGALYHRLRDASESVAYFSFTEIDTRRASATSFLSSAVFQLLNQDPGRFSTIRDLVVAVDNSNAWTYAGILALLRSLLGTKRHSRPLHLIIVGLQRCDQSLQPLLEALFVIAADKHSLTPLKIALFSHNSSDFQAILERYGEVCLPSVVLAGDITSSMLVGPNAADQAIKDRPYLATPMLLPKVTAAFERCKNATAVSLTLQSISGIDAHKVPLTLKSLASLLETLPPSVSDAVASRFRALENWARVALGWICYAKRPLTTEELATALMITNDNGDFDLSSDPDNPYIDISADIETTLGLFLRVGSGGVVFNNDNVRRLFLQLIEEEREQHPDLPGSRIPGDADIARLLLKYLSWPRFADPMVEALKKEEFVEPSGPLFGLATYAIRFIPAHHVAAVSSADLLELVKNPRVVMLWSILNSKLNPTASPPKISIADPFLLAAQLGMTGIVQELKGNARAVDRNVAIDIASWGGHIDVVTTLTQDADSEHIFKTARGLEYASARGYEEIVEELLGHMHASQTLSPSQLDELMCRAAELGFERQVFMFLDYGAKVESAPYGITPLQYAARNGHASLVYSLLTRAGADPDSEAATTNDGPLLLAAGMGHEPIVEHLITAKADVTKVTNDKMKRSALFLAAEHGHEAIVSYLLDCAEAGKCRCSIDLGNADGMTPVAIACIRGHDEVVRLLLKAGASVNTVDSDGHTALYHSVRPGNEVLTEAILKQAGSPDVFEEFKDIGDVFLRVTELGQTELVRLCLSRAKHISTRLVDYGSEPSGRRALHIAAENGFEEIVRLLIGDGAETDEPDADGLTPLVTAAVAGKASIVGHLLGQDANTQRVMPDDQPLLSYVVRHTQDSLYHAEVVRILLNSDIDPNVLDSDKRTALHWAASMCSYHVTEALLRCPAVDVHAKGRWGWNALHYLARDNESEGGISVARLLIEAGADPLAADMDGWLPLHFAADCGNIGMMEFLLETRPSSLTLEDTDGSSALHFGVEHPTALEWLITRGLDVDFRDNRGRTALVDAAERGLEDSVRVLLANNADINATESSGQTALHRAAYRDRVTVGRLLLEKDRTLLSCRDDANLSALHLAIDAKAFDFAMMLLDEYYAHVESSDNPTLEDLSASNRITGETPLISAVIKDSNHEAELIRTLRKLGAATEKKGRKGSTALLAAVRRGKAEVISALLDDSSDNWPDVNIGGGTHPTALHEAAQTGKLDIVQALIKYGASVNAQGGQFNTAHSAAAYRGWAEIFEYLLSHTGQDVDVNLSGGNFANSLCTAIYTYSLMSAFIDRLLEAGANVNARDAQGRSALHIAAASGRWDALVHLRRASGVNPAPKDEQGRTLLHHAAMSGDTALVLEILGDAELASPVDEGDVDGWTPLHWACRQQTMGVVEVLVDQWADTGVKVTSVLREPTRDGWTPENIATAHDATYVATYVRDRLLEAEKGEEVGGEAAEPRPESARPGRGRRWKVLNQHPEVQCDGCFLMVSRILSRPHIIYRSCI